ncbi:MAG TPA: hypothetical protein PLU75_06030 [Oscillospiraceae bacterium]|nr:hypothetical protein [Oscillospiraceae bacterium]HRW57806.1 hypothetical protein [Oscillospiraceae bacterium]
MGKEMEAQKWRAKRELIKKIARELLEQCSGYGFTYSDVEQICNEVRIGAKDLAFIHPRGVRGIIQNRSVKA